jgi:hypothetical protein
VALPISRRICDGSTNIRFAFGYEPGGQVLPYTSVLYDLGGDFLFVDGTCQYWIQQPSIIQDEYGRYRAFREGVLTPEQETALHETVSYDDFSAAPACAARETMDADIARVWDGTRVYRCPGGGLQVSPDWPLRTELYASASPVGGPVRIQVGKTTVVASGFVHDWPLEVSPDQYLIDDGDTKSFRVDDTASVEALRSLRDAALTNAAQAPGAWQGVIRIEPAGYVPDGDIGYVLSVRDELPFTDTAGLWSPP